MSRVQRILRGINMVSTSKTYTDNFTNALIYLHCNYVIQYRSVIQRAVLFYTDCA